MRDDRTDDDRDEPDIGASAPTDQALVLNRHWTPVSTTTVRRALVLLCRSTASAICPASYEVYDLDAWIARSLDTGAALARERLLRTPRFAIEKPEVILLLGYAGVPRREVSFSRRNLYRRDGYACQYCGRRRPLDELSIDHVLPRSRGGKTTWENCVLACVRCNTKKANKTLRESGFQLARAPGKPTWSPLLESIPRAHPPSWRKFLERSEHLAG
ncbi:MAG: HNH endonuclease [Planctomycetes bacterium]|nr:HNH endonuclease [Planctomycetota bacterium]